MVSWGQPVWIMGGAFGCLSRLGILRLPYPVSQDILWRWGAIVNPVLQLPSISILVIVSRGLVTASGINYSTSLYRICLGFIFGIKSILHLLPHSQYLNLIRMNHLGSTVTARGPSCVSRERKTFRLQSSTTIRNQGVALRWKSQGFIVPLLTWTAAHNTNCGEGRSQ